jgi:hypothetical protein
MTPIPPPSVRLGRVRGAPFGALAILAIATACASGSGAVAGGGPDGDAPATPEARLADRVLTASGIESVIDARARAFTRQVALLAGDLTDDELERLVPAVQTAFAPDLLRGDIASLLEDEAPPGRLQEVLDWLEEGSSAEARRIVEAYEPPLSLEEWLTEYTVDPPSVVRIRLVARWTEARGTGDFFVLLEQALSEAAHLVEAHFRPRAEPFVPLRGDELLDRLEDSYNAAVVTALHASETVPDSVLAGASRELESEAGRWYVQTYQLAVAEAVRAAGIRVVQELSSRAGPGAR